MARSLSGPWLTPADDTFDGRAFYAAKTAGDGERRFLFGWNPTRQGETDTGAWQWGGNLVVHELRQQLDGTLAVSQPESVAEAYGGRRGGWSFAPTLIPATGDCDVEGDGVLLSSHEHFAYVAAGDLPVACRISARVTCGEGVRACGLMPSRAKTTRRATTSASSRCAGAWSSTPGRGPVTGLSNWRRSGPSP